MNPKCCLYCNQIFIKLYNESLKSWGLRKYCSRKCQHKSMQKIRVCSFCKKTYIGNGKGGRKVYCSPHCFGKEKGFQKGFTPWDKGTVGMLKAWNKGLRMPDEQREKQSGENCHFWKGGITSINEKIRKSLVYKFWRLAVFTRDNYTCQICFKRGCLIHAHHIKTFSLFPKLRLAIDNGKTLYVDCHKKTETWGHHFSQNGG